MTKRDDKIINLIAIALLVVAAVLLFFVGALLFVEFSSSASTGKVVIVNLADKEYVSNTCKYVKIPYRTQVPYEVSYMEEFSRRDYSSRSMARRVVGYLGNDIDEYIVYIENYGHDDEYVEVKFIFKDYYGKEHSYVIGKYIDGGEEGKFVYRDVYANKDKHYDFRYEVVGDSRTYMKEVNDVRYRWETKYKMEMIC